MQHGLCVLHHFSDNTTGISQNRNHSNLNVYLNPLTGSESGSLHFSPDVVTGSETGLLLFFSIISLLGFNLALQTVWPPGGALQVRLLLFTLLQI